MSINFFRCKIIPNIRELSYGNLTNNRVSTVAKSPFLKINNFDELFALKQKGLANIYLRKIKFSMKITDFLPFLSRYRRVTVS